MADDQDKLHTPLGEVNADKLTTDGAGSGASDTDTGGLDAEGNELGVSAHGRAEGRPEAERMKDAEAGAQK